MASKLPPIMANTSLPTEAGQGGNNVKISATRAGGDMKWGHGKTGGGKSGGHKSGNPGGTKKAMGY